MIQKKFLPIGIQDFRNLRERNCIYVDKTELIYTICTESKHYFLARPRRFGKSLLLSTIKELYSDNKESLFKGLYIEKHLPEFKTRPTVHINLSGLGTDTDLGTALHRLLDTIEIKHALQLPKIEPLGIRFETILQAIYNKHNTSLVLLVDEYDAPIIARIGEPPELKHAIDLLRTLFGRIKALDEIIELSFFTGITNIGKDSYLSTLNHLLNITNHHRFATICGYSHDDIDIYFHDYLVALATAQNLSIHDAKSLIFKWYNGYSWDGLHFLLIPFSVLNAFSLLTVDTVWAQSASLPKVFLDFVQNSNFDLQTITAFENIETDSSIFQELNIENLSITSFLIQTGLLTVKYKTNYGDYIVGYPNLEVKQAVISLIGSHIFAPKHQTLNNRAYHIAKIINSLHTTRDITPLAKILSSLFASIPHQLLQHKRESLYHSALYIIFYLASLQVDAEVSTSNGRADVIVHTQHATFILECKYEKSAAIAVKQIFDKKYYAPYLTDGKQIIAIGCNFTDAGLELAAEFIKS